MALKTIPDLPTAASLTGSEPIETVQSGVSVKTTTQAIADLGGLGYLVYTAELSATAGNAPTETVVHKNTIVGSISYVYNGSGNYIITRTGDFAAGKVFGLANAQGDDTSTAYGSSVINLGDGTLLLIIGGGSGTYLNISIEIRVYP